MIWFALLLALFPVLAGWRLRQQGWSWAEAGRIAALTAVGCWAASPFITLRSLGSGEAYNYSLAVADTITQMRAGVFPVFVGQSEFAFNSRLHPLRTAVYYTHSAGVLDLITLRQLTYWQVQNLNLALSIMATVFVAYLCLRKITALPSGVACLLACWYGLCPGLLAPAYGMELYMTVTAAPFLPLAALGAALSVETPRFRWYALMAIGLAGAWLTHPPVAAWMSLACGVIVALGLCTRRPSLATFVNLGAAALLGGLLGGWAFASALTITSDNLVVANIAANREVMAQAIAEVTSRVGWAALQPVRQGGGSLGDFQLGYAGWILLGIGAGGTVRLRRRAPAALLAAIALCLALTLPIPWLHGALWSLLPTGFSSLTNPWPMQRAYLVISALVIMLFGCAWTGRTQHAPPSPFSIRWAHWPVGVVIALGGWTLWQAWQFIVRGHRAHYSEETTQRHHRPGNRAILQAYYQLPIPDSYHAGPRDPELELRLLDFRDGLRVLLDNAAPAPQPRIVATGAWRVTANAPPDRWQLTPALSLAAGKRYRLHVEFLQTQFDGLLTLAGPGLFRELMLADTSSKRGFGLRPGQSRSLPLASDLAGGETVNAALTPSRPEAPPTADFARFQLEEIDPARLPLRLLSLVPNLRVAVDAPAAGWVETPRSYVAGYEATVDGVTVYPRAGPDGLMLVPVPAGQHTVELTYRAPPVLRMAAWISLAGWLILAGLLGSLLLVPSRTASALSGWLAARQPRPGTVITASLLAVALGSAWWLTSSHRAQPIPGPLHLRVALPMHGISRSEPLASTGRGPGSTVIFLRSLGHETFQLGVDTWGQAVKTSAALKLDCAQPVDLKITTGAFYAGHQRAMSALSLDQQAWLFERTLIWLDGRLVLDFSRPLTDAAKPRDWTIGHQATGGGSHQTRFSGRLIEQRWLPAMAAECPFPSPESLQRESGPLRVNVRLPTGKTGQAEPLASFGDAKAGTTVFIQYTDDTHARFGMQGTEGPTIFSAPLPVDYRQPVTVELSHPTLYPRAHPTLQGYAPRHAAQLREKLRLRINGRPVLNEPLPSARDVPPGLARIGVNTGVAHFAEARFTGQILSTTRVSPADWPLPPGDPDAATRPGSAGPLELTVQLPALKTGRIETLLTTGKTGAGTIVMVHYLDADHIRLGVDVWGKALFWSEPLPVDYAARQIITVSASGLYPGDNPAFADLRAQLSVSLNGQRVISEKIFAYDSTPAEISVGRSVIGGSHASPVFSGEILMVRRHPPTALQK